MKAVYVRGGIVMNKENTCNFSENKFDLWSDDTIWTCNKCGGDWSFIDGSTPQENGMNYCPSCGRKIVEYIPRKLDIEEDEE